MRLTKANIVRIVSEWDAVNLRLTSIAGRSISTLIKTQGISDLYRIYLCTQRDSIDYNLANIPDDFTETGEGEFDQEYMSKQSVIELIDCSVTTIRGSAYYPASDKLHWPGIEGDAGTGYPRGFRHNCKVVRMNRAKATSGLTCFHRQATTVII